ncbi:S8 family serine peptidase [Gordonibacter massiliensis (ex Traore et al. 2017)]|uniref:S8 family serine peptidase n=1 Tax=Gordonibacter massiliensis (ex Traore et al. 2017) TaxID=1841863 RepID=UPI001C8B5D51|nr:S8 family serine peptidase [Gordonibacter massiliensis (ex Traore et al. 2017)]MBX9032729.1 S8 family serine peptidase [Gordonibacter massiliensis (ex Traore et al. 2017)]
MLRKILSLSCALALSCALVPTAALASPPAALSLSPVLANATDASSWFTEESLAELLAAGPYVEGEAIAVVDNTATAPLARNGSPLDFAEPLMNVTASAYREATGEAVANEAALGQGVSAYSLSNDAPASAGAEGVGAASIVLVKQAGTTTEELLRLLAEDPRVASAEPNYTMQLADADDASGAAEVSAALASANDLPNGVEAIPDLTSYQWASENSGETMVLQHDDSVTQPGFDINQTGWNTREANAAGTVAVFDTGIDYNHPDLKSVMWDGASLREIVGEGGEYGINVSENGKGEDEIMDDDEHGTHCAGIIAAAWNGQGTSGVANGVKLVGVKYLDGNGRGTLGGELWGYAYLSEIAQATNLKVINNSWGGSSLYTAMRLAITQLGEQGVVSVFATGNDSHDTDELPATNSALANNPYAVVVNASDSTGKLAAYSNYGAYTTNLAAPGSSILSTVPTNKTVNYFPEAVAPDDPANAPVAFETYKDGASSCASLVADDEQGNPTDIGGVEDSIRYDAGSGALRVSLSQMNEVSADDLAQLACAVGTKALSARSFDVKMRVDEDDLDKATYFSLRCTNPQFKEADPGRVYVGISGIDAVDEGGRTVFAVNESQAATARLRMVDGWSMTTLNVKALIEEEGVREVALDADGCMTVHCVALLPYDFAAAPTADSLVFDCFGVGAGEGALGSYDVFSGTSMAAPVATGAAAVLVNEYDEKTNDEIAQQGPDALAKAAALRAARLRGAVSALPAFEGTCTTDGHLDLAKTDGERAPSILTIGAGDGGDTVAVSGYFFGAGSGALALNGEPAEIVSWEANRVLAKRPADLQSGVVEITLTAENGTSARAKMSLSLPSVPLSANLYERNLPSPMGAEGFAERDVDVCALEACGGDVYLLGSQSNYFLAQGLWRFDVERSEWSLCADLPQEHVQYASLATCEGALYLLGSFVEEDTGTVVQQAWRYNAAADGWLDEAVCEEGSKLSTLAAFEGGLVLVGGTDGNGDILGVRTYDPQSGAGDEVLAFEQVLLYPQVVASGSLLYVSQGFDSDFDFQATTLMRLLHANGAWTVDDLSAIVPADDDSLYYPVLALAGYEGGMAMVGLPNKGADTALLGNDAQELSAFPKALSSERVRRPAAVAVGGYLYALGFSTYEQGGMVFRATALGGGGGEEGGGGSSDNGGGEGSEGAAAGSAEPSPLVSTGDSLGSVAMACVVLAGACALACLRLRPRRR